MQVLDQLEVSTSAQSFSELRETKDLTIILWSSIINKEILSQRHYSRT